MSNNLECRSISDKFKEAKSSTPNNLAPSRRRPIHSAEVSPSPIKVLDVSNEEITTSQQYEEKIQRSRPEYFLNDCENETTQSSSHSSSYFSESSLNRKSNKPNISNEEYEEELFGGNSVLGYFIIFIALVVGLLFFVLPFNLESEESLHYNNKITIQDLQTNFPLQSEELWNALESGIQEVKNLNKPSVFLLLYEEEAEDTVNNILFNVSKYAECILNKNCEIEPIVLTSSSLNSEKAVIDYGYVIDKYKSELKSRSVMIVKNLDRVMGEVAQAFHSMCDEYTPLVEKSVFFFTIKVDNLRNIQKSNVHIAEEILRSNWSNLNEDIFEPLFTRISSIVLRIISENT